MFLTIWNPFGPIWTILDNFKQELIFCSEAPLQNPTLSIWGKKSLLSEMVQKEPDGPQKVPNGQKHLGLPYWPLLNPFRPLLTLTSLPCWAIFGQKWTIFGPSPVMNGGPQSEKKAHHHISYVWPACGTSISPVWNINMFVIYEKCQK